MSTFLLLEGLQGKEGKIRTLVKVSGSLASGSPTSTCTPRSPVASMYRRTAQGFKARTAGPRQEARIWVFQLHTQGRKHPSHTQRTLAAS